MSWTSSPWKWYVLLSVIIQIHNYTFILKTFWKHLTHISDLSVDSIKARSQIKVKSLISCMCQYSTLLEQLSLNCFFGISIFTVHFLLCKLCFDDETYWNWRLDQNISCRHHQQQAVMKKDCFIIHKLTLNVNWNYFITKRPMLSKYVFSSYYLWVLILCSSCVHVFYMCFWQRYRNIKLSLKWINFHTDIG